jgi:hypothetical protein
MTEPSPTHTSSGSAERVLLTYKTPSGRGGRYGGFWREQLQAHVDRFAQRGCTDFAWMPLGGNSWHKIEPSDKVIA